jgi:hypothetical protein
MNYSQVGLWYESVIRWWNHTGDTPAYRASVVLRDIHGKHLQSGTSELVESDLALVLLPVSAFVDSLPLGVSHA